MNPTNKIWGLPFPLAGFFVLVLTYVWIFGRATYFVWMEKNHAAKSPRLAIIPVPLSDTSISSAPGKTVSYFGYQFEAPSEVKELRVANSIALVGSGSGQWVVGFFNPATSRGFVSTGRDELGPLFGEVARIYGEDNVKSDYDLVRAILNASPSQLSLIFPRIKEVRAATFMMLKETEILGGETGLYSFEIGHLRGFQLGDPARTKNVHVKAFDAENHKFEFLFGGKPGPDLGLAQADINRVLQTLRPAIPTQQATQMPPKK